MNQIHKKLILLALSLLMTSLIICACSSEEKNPHAAKALKPWKLNPPQEEVLFSIPGNSNLVHYIVSEYGNTVAFWVRKSDSIQLLITGREPYSFKGHVGFQKGMSFHMIQPKGNMDIRIAGEGAEKDAWLVWGPGTGMAGESLDNYLFFDKNGTNVFYCLYDMGRWLWIKDDTPLEDYHNLTAPISSEGGEMVVWIDKSTKGSERVFINGKPDSVYDEIYSGSIYISPNGEHYFYMAHRADKDLAIWDGIEQKEYKALCEGFVFSPDGDRFAYSAKENGKHFVVLDGVEGVGYDGVSGLTFSPDGKHFAHRADKDGKVFFVIDGKEQKLQFEKLSNEFLFAEYGGRYAYAGIREKNWYVVDNGKEGEPCTGIFAMVISTDGKHFAKGEIDADGKLHVFIDGKEHWVHDGEPAMRPMMSPDGTRLLYGIRRNSRVILVIDGVEGPDYSAIGGIDFSPDGKHLAYMVKADDGKIVVYVDDEIRQELDSVLTLLSYTSGGQLLYCAYKDKKWHMVIDNELGEPYDEIYLPPSKVLKLLPDESFEYIVREGNDIVKVRHSSPNK